MLRDEATTEHQALAEVRKVKDTAGNWSKGERPEEADPVRVLAGLVHQLAEQLERLLVANGPSPLSEDPPDPSDLSAQDRPDGSAPA
jgi:hypothetical protein